MQSSPHPIRQLLSERILILDGAMGTMIQGYNLEEADFRSERFKNHGHSLQGNNDLLSLTRPDVILEIHQAYLAAGADLIETNTFNSTAIAQSDYGTEGLAYELNVASAKIARMAADEFTKQSADKPRFVVGILGPTNKTASLSPDVNNPGFRAIDFDALVDAYTEQARGLIDGGADLLMVETVFDTLNCKAALFAVYSAVQNCSRDIPISVSGTITDASGRTLSGQTVEAFWTSISHIPLLSVGLNCALGAQDMRPYVEALSEAADCFISCHPNAGLPNAFGGYDETPEDMSSTIQEFAQAGFLNIAGAAAGLGPTTFAPLGTLWRICHPARSPRYPHDFD